MLITEKLLKQEMKRNREGKKRRINKRGYIQKEHHIKMKIKFIKVMVEDLSDICSFGSKNEKESQNDNEKKMNQNSK